MASTRQIIGAVVGMIVGLIVSLSTLETVITIVSDVNTTGWDFTGYEGAIALLDLIPFVYVASVLLLCVTLSFTMTGGLNFIDYSQKDLDMLKLEVITLPT
jgi:hypothetical protein